MRDVASNIVRTRDLGSPDLSTNHTKIDYVGLIQLAAKAYPELGYKRLARLLRTVGVDVSRTGVAEVLAHRNSRWKHGSVNALVAPPPPRVICVTAGAQRSRTPHATQFCSSCGVRISLSGTCRCS